MGDAANEHMIAGGVVLNPEDSQNVFSHYGQADTLPLVSRYVMPDFVCADDPQGRTYAALVKGAPLAVASILVRSPRTGRAIKLFIRGECKAAITAAGHSFYTAAKEEESAGDAKELMRARAAAIKAEDREWRLAYVVDKMRCNAEISPLACQIAAAAFAAPVMCGGEPDLILTLGRWIPLRASAAAEQLFGPFLAKLDRAQCAAFMLELALRRLGNVIYVGDPQGGWIVELDDNGVLELDEAENEAAETLAVARETGRAIPVEVDFVTLKAIHLTVTYEAGKSAKSFTYHGRRYVPMGWGGQYPFESWEMIPLQGYDRETQAANTTWHYPNGNRSYDGYIVRQRGLDYALRGPVLHFVQRSGQCSACGCTELSPNSDHDAPNEFEWANAKETLCADCAGKEAEI